MTCKQSEKFMTPLAKLFNALFLAVFVNVAQAAVVTGIDATAQLPFWEWSNQTVSIRLVQRLPDQTRAFFAARGFSRDHVERIAQSCVFQTVFKNIAAADSDMVIRYDLTEWQIRFNDSQPKQKLKQRLKVKQQWMDEWKQSNAPPKAQIAFSWSLLPTQQKYKAGDYNWGMTTYNLPPGKHFDLTLVWYQNEQRHTAVIPDVQCAADIQTQPAIGIGG
jgi:hypothetical protein